MKIAIYDTTLRDGEQSPNISFTIEDKIRITKSLDDLGIAVIEAGNPASNPKDREFLERLKDIQIKNAKIAAFGSTCKVGVNANEDEVLKALAQIPCDIITIFGKSSVLHAEKIIMATKEENLRMIADSIRYLKENMKAKELYFDAEHFFDGYREDADYSAAVIATAETAGADMIILCDTNGGVMPDEIGSITTAVRKMTNVPIGIHCHNDSGLAVASSIEAVNCGAVQVQGTVNGFGERCGNANLCVLIPNLQLKLGYECVGEENLKKLGFVSRFVSEIANEAYDERMPFTGSFAFTHKAGMHIDGVIKHNSSFEHISPEAVGNSRNFLISGASGRTAVLDRLKEIDSTLTKDSSVIKNALEMIKSNEHDGYQYENAEGSLMLLLLEAAGKRHEFFRVETFKLVLSEPKNTGTDASKTAALIKIAVDGKEEITAAEGEGPVNALDIALRKALLIFYPRLFEMKLVDYKVRVLDSTDATAAKVRVIIESSDKNKVWRTVGVSTDIIEASFRALTDSIEYKLSLDKEEL